MFSIVQSGYQPTQNKSTESDDETIETIEEFDEDTGETKRKTITIKTKKVSRLKDFDKNNLNGIANINREESVVPTLIDIQNQLDEPIYSVVEDTENIDSNTYYLELEQFIKKQGERKNRVISR